jgi:zinc protease
MIPKMMRYPVSIHYSGQKNADEVKQILNQYPFSATSPDKPMIGSNTGYALNRVNYSEPTIYVLNRKDARQTSINFYAPLPKMSRQEEATQYCFNSYFGTDMSALVFQEIRELRSLAYACYMAMIIPQFESQPNYSIGYIGCQGDKTKEALTTMIDLIRKMPEKPDKMDAIKSSQIENRYTARPFFRYLSWQVEWWKQQGYNSDPNELYLGYMQNLTFEDIKEYYKKNIQNMPLSIALLGNKDNIPMDELKKLGKVVVLEENDIRIK